MARKIIFPFIFLLFIFPLPGQEGIKLEWEDLPGHTFLLELKKDNRLLFERRISDPLIYLDLSPGEYEYRISFLNKFEKTDAVTDWITLTVLKDLEPVIIDVPPHTIFAGERSQRVTVHTSDIMEGALIRLERDGKAENLAYEKKGNNTIEIVLETEHLAAGQYDLRIINPSGSETVKERCITLKEKVSPRVTELEPRTALLDTQNPRVILKGSNFDKDIVAFLERDGQRHRLPISEYISEDEIILWFNLVGLKAGSYDLVLINPPLEEMVLTGAFTIVDPQKIRDEDYYENLRWGTDLLIGLPLADAVFDQSVTNFTFAEGAGILTPFNEIEAVLRADINKDLPLINFLGWTGRVAFLAPNDRGDFFTTVTMGLYGRTRFPFPVNLFAEAQMGSRWMGMHVEGERISTAGTLLTWGGGLVINYDRLLVEVSQRNDTWIIQDGQVDITQISLRLGYRF